MKRSHGLLLELGGELYFLPAEIARSIVHRPVVTRVPGSELGLALLEGRVLPVLELGPARTCAVLCELAGAREPEVFALVGAEVIEVGEYPEVPGGVLVGRRTVRLLELDGILETVQGDRSALARGA